MSYRPESNTHLSESAPNHLAAFPVKRADLPELVLMLREFAITQDCEDQVTTNTELLEAALFSISPFVFAAIASDSDEGAKAGYIMWSYSYSTWSGRSGVRVNDLYIRPEYRGKGASRILVQHVARFCIKRESCRMEWGVSKDNIVARSLHTSLGAQQLTGHIEYRLAPDLIAIVAEDNKD